MNDFVQNVDSFVKPTGMNQQSAKKSPAAPAGLEGRWGLVNYQNKAKPRPFQINECPENILFLLGIPGQTP
jgi:hypothetical protein